ncbi:hypothetical protein RRG08_015053 [Elysia crispata]|uniref:Uncharacterized protein n=1 Tax=Elysia crispata TaxID=231223 RepID=A0AAE1EA84_9GAST|nr:hypothetical protein RRG08_015053 [Elysia crispata]
MTKTSSSTTNGWRTERVPRWRATTKTSMVTDRFDGMDQVLVWTKRVKGTPVILLAPIEAIACGNHMARLCKLLRGLIS